MSDELFGHRVTRGAYDCPWCDEPNDAAIYTGEGDHSPRPGDIGLCFGCSRPMVYQEHGKPRRPTEAEWKILNADENITAQRRAIYMSSHGHQTSYEVLDPRHREAD